MIAMAAAAGGADAGVPRLRCSSVSQSASAAAAIIDDHGKEIEINQENKMVRLIFVIKPTGTSSLHAPSLPTGIPLLSQWNLPTLMPHDP